ncbi:hypothetical protein [Thermoanaerobacterium xylanolyticum]|uniref:hypothetical protein n=1 Tax=Thermoanaerobacterium xylanolyticum TaxID=29329 RepID=UPI0001FAEFDA|nr:hypothetical protein [Thermoanaerobacterium xylanolyticum]
MELAIPRKSLGMEIEKGPIRFDFKWSDNIKLGNDGTEFYVYGDTAPNGRFFYRYQELV